MKKIILTGSATGFGLLAVKSLAAKGHTVFATMRNVKGANAEAAANIRNWAKEHNADVRVVELDVVSDRSVKTAIEEIATATSGKIDVLINNAGIGFIGISESLTTEQTEQLFQVNTIGPDRVIKAVLPYMHAQKEGLIINVTSVQARNHMPLFTVYNATKAALDALSVGYFYELRSLGIDVAIIQPGAFPTTDIATKSLTAGNPAAESYYGTDMKWVKQGLAQVFTPTPESPDPQEVADQMVSLVEASNGKRPLWSIVGGGPAAAYFDQINQTTKTVVDTVLSHLGV